MYIGKKLEKILKYQCISLAELSDKSGIAKEECEDFLNDRKEPTLEVFVQIVNALGALPSDFIEIERRNVAKLLKVHEKIQGLPPEKQRKLFEEIKNFLP